MLARFSRRSRFDRLAEGTWESYLIGYQLFFSFLYPLDIAESACGVSGFKAVDGAAAECALGDGVGPGVHV